MWETHSLHRKHLAQYRPSVWPPQQYSRARRDTTEARLMRVLLDTNVALDSLLARAPWHVDADEVLRRSKPGVIPGRLGAACRAWLN